MEIDDIDGARPKKSKQIDIKTREVNKLDDIEGAKAVPRHAPRERSGGYNVYDYSDITKQQFVSTRVTNPLNPSYTIRDENGQLAEIGEVVGSKPNVLPPERRQSELMKTSLRTDDIMGATAGTKGQGVFAENHARREYRDTNRVDDIEGAHSGSLRKAPRTNRVTNPLDPCYDAVGGKELSDPNN